MTAVSADVDVLIVGAGIAGMSAGIFTARAGLETELVNTGSSILNRNAHLENYPGFPKGINPRLLLSMMKEQAGNQGCRFTSSGALAIDEDETFHVRLQGKERTARRLILTSWSDCSYADSLGLETSRDGSKIFLVTDEDGRTSRDGVYAAGRIAGVRHQTVVAAGDGGNVGLSVVEELHPDYYRDWVVPEGYFTDRGRDLPEGCEEISDNERRRRAHEARKELRSFLDNPPETEPKPHPTFRDE